MVMFMDFLGLVGQQQNKTHTLNSVIKKIDEVLSSSEVEGTILHWGSTFTGFSTAITIAGISAVNPILGGIAATVSVASAVGVIGSTVLRKNQNSKNSDRLNKIRLVLKSQPLADLAALWELAGDDVFLDAVLGASNSVKEVEGKITCNNRQPIYLLIDHISSIYGLSRDEVISAAKDIKASTSPKLPTRQQNPQLPQTPTPQTPQTKLPTPPTATPQLPPPTKPNFEQLGLRTLDAIAKDAEKSVRGGVVLLAAPGGGKTTYIGTVWGRLKKTYGDKFHSVAVIVKPTDIEAFKGVADKVVCVRQNPTLAAIEILKFVDRSIGNHGQVRRLFLDDFLTLNQMLQTSLKGLWLDPTDYSIYTKRDEETPDVQPLLPTITTALNELWLVGREYNSALWVSSHSSNVNALPFCASRESRSVGDLVYLANTDKREFIEQVLNNPNLIGDNTKRQMLKEQLDSLKDVGLKRIVLSNCDNWTLGVVPESVREEYEGFRVEWQSKTQKKPVVEQLESNYSTNNDSNPSLIEDGVLRVLKRSDSGVVKFDSIRTSRVWQRDLGINNPTKAELQTAIDNLIKKERLCGGDEGYLTIEPSSLD